MSSTFDRNTTGSSLACLSPNNSDHLSHIGNVFLEIASIKIQIVKLDFVKKDIRDFAHILMSLKGVNLVNIVNIIIEISMKILKTKNKILRKKLKPCKPN